MINIFNNFKKNDTLIFLNIFYDKHKKHKKLLKKVKRIKFKDYKKIILIA
jgi:hypothetical protein